jgi:flavin reductase (DIM6/NTAB) family NADH-FMN oxidoreductase RutF
MTESDADAFRRAMQCRADTVHLITYVTPDGQVEGMTATAVTALSLSPPSLLVCISRRADARDSIQQTRIFALNVLGSSHARVAEAAGRSGGSREFRKALTKDPELAQAPELEDALATFQCRVLEERDLFTHTVFFAEVLQARVGAPGEPLLHHRGEYATVGAKVE